MSKALILVISADFAPYGDMIKNSQETWDSVEVEGMTTVYYCGQKDSGQRTIVKDGKVVYLPVKEGLFNMGHKTIAALEYALYNHHFTYLIRPNSSCFIHKKNLDKYLNSLPKENLYHGLLTESVYNVDYLWGGCPPIMSRDVVEAIVANKHLWNHEYIEDVSCSDLAHKLGIEIKGKSRLAALHKEENQWICHYYRGDDGGGVHLDSLEEIKKKPKLKDQFFFRIKQDGKRHSERQIMLHLHEVLND